MAPIDDVRLSTRSVFGLAAPLIAVGVVQTVLNLTDTWFIGRLSSEALSAMSAVQGLALVLIVLAGGCTHATQIMVAQAFGARRRARAANAAWTCVWIALFLTPVFAAVAWAGQHFIPRLGLSGPVTRLALDFWEPRMLGAPVAIAFGALTAFFNGTGRSRETLAATVLVVLVNAVFNELLIFRFGLGIAGAAWATNLAQCVGFALCATRILNPSRHEPARLDRSWRLRPSTLVALSRLAFPIGLSYAGDFSAFAIFQLMQSKHSTVDGAATQIAMQLVVVSYLVGAGLAETSSLLVARAYGARAFAEVRASGNFVRARMMWMMGSLGVGVALLGPLVAPLFVTSTDPLAAEISALAVRLLWIGALYQVAEAVYLGSEYALRGIGDVSATAGAVVVMSVLVLTPLAHVLTFASGTGYVTALPGLGWGAVGGWSSLAVYMIALALFTSTRWRVRSRALIDRRTEA